MSMLRRVLDRESIVKTNLTESLVECVKELQLRYAAQRGVSLKNDETTNSLCWILEAVFIHGLKNRFLKSMSSVLTSRENQVPEPSFWEFLLVFCHQEVILQILQLSLINTDIGRCRAWLRVAINDGLLISYLQLMLGDKSTLKDYYKPSAFLRDADRCDIMKSYLYGIESYDFQLAFNSSLLNTWNTGPLSLVGLWTPTDTIYEGFDIAENMDDKDMQAIPQLHNQARTPPKTSFFSVDSNPNFRVPLLEEDEALRVILSSRGSTGTTSASRSAASSRRNSDGTSPLPFLNSGIHGTTVTVNVATTITNPSTNTSASNSPKNESVPSLKRSEPLPILSPIPTVSLATKMRDAGAGAAAAIHDERSSKKVVDVRIWDISSNLKAGEIGVAEIKGEENNVRDNQKPMNEFGALEMRREENRLQVQRANLKNQVPTPEEELSYAALFDNYITDTVVGSPIIGGSMFDISPFGSKSYNLNTTTTSSDPALGSSLEENRSVSLPPIDAYTHRIPREVGLDTQNHRCRSCERPIGMIYGSVRVCGFTGYYYCSECHVNDEFVIPSRILLNWDFNRYFVSKEAKDFLTELLDQPILNVKEINPKLYHHVEECAEIEQLRTTLQSISIYLRTCKEPILKEFQKDIWPKEYFYENIHLYSLSDLLNIPNRTLSATLTKLVSLGRNHIKCCLFCKQKGFVCEVCRDNRVIFPFDLEKIYKCSSCGAVYHNTCMNNGKSCPRCERWKISAYDADLTCL